jgi:glucose-6-phosphate isomerase
LPTLKAVFPNIVLELEDTTEKSFGYMVYFFEKACAVSGYMLGINPLTSPVLKATKRICLLFSANLATKIRKLLSKKSLSSPSHLQWC